MEALVMHLAERYGVPVDAVAALDVGVWRVERADGSVWVARVFGPQRPAAEVEGDAAILRRLEEAGFPAERCADPEPVSAYQGGTVLVTDFVAGERPRGGRAWAVLGALLGRLHARPAEGVRPGGAWHHLAPAGGPAEEVDAAIALLEGAGVGGELLDRVAGLDDAADLPYGFVHPDFVPVNAITTAEGRTVVVDWAGAGRGPRLWSLGFLLWAGGARDLRLVDAVVSRYRRHVTPTADELERLEGAIAARPLTMDAWAVGVGRRREAEVLRELPARDALCARIAARARAAFEAD